jgi:HTH-type transcriptional regulator/antitoxin HigA
MNTVTLEPIADAWARFHAASQIGHIQNQAQFRRMTAIADALSDDGAARRNHPHHGLFLLVLDLIGQYEAARAPLPEVRGTDVLRFLMQQHGLRQGDLPEIGSQGVVSEILNGKRELTRAHIAALSERFGVSPASFF